MICQRSQGTWEGFRGVWGEVVGCPMAEEEGVEFQESYCRFGGVIQDSGF